MSAVRSTATYLVQAASVWHQCEPLQLQVQLPSGDLVQGEPLKTKRVGSANELPSAWSTPMGGAQPWPPPGAISARPRHCRADPTKGLWGE